MVKIYWYYNQVQTSKCEMLVERQEKFKKSRMELRIRMIKWAAKESYLRVGLYTITMRIFMFRKQTFNNISPKKLG